MSRGRRTGVPGALRRGRTFRALAAALVLLVPGASRALECPSPASADPRLASIPAERRTAYLRLRLDAGRPSAEAWTWTWGVVDGALTAGQLAAIPFTASTSGKWVLVAGAASSALGVVQVLTLPIVPEAVADEGGGCAELARLEASLERSGRNVELGSGLLAQLGNLAVNAAVGVAAGAADGRWQTGAVTFGIGWAIGEAQILTMPMGFARDLERYRSGELGAAPLASGPPRIAATGSPRGRGAAISIAMTF